MDYKRLISYIYSYQGGIKDSNVGFAKALVNQNKFKLGISIRGINIVSPEVLVVYMIVDDKGYNLVRLGECIAQNGQAEFNGEYEANAINGSSYGFEEIKGLAVAKQKTAGSMLLTMWTDEEINPNMVRLEGRVNTLIKPEPVVVETMEQEEKQEVKSELKKSDIKNDLPVTPNLEKLFERADYVDAFDDDYFYDCIEISPEKLAGVKLRDNHVVENSFLLHGFYSFRHILFGRVGDNLDNTKYFIGVPGLYCNRERYMASIFGFNNFKRSHRSDYKNPSFGYWYQEI